MSSRESHSVLFITQMVSHKSYTMIHIWKNSETTFIWDKMSLESKSYLIYSYNPDFKI